MASCLKKVGFRVQTDVRNGACRCLTVQPPDQPSFPLGVFKPGAQVLDAATEVLELQANGAMQPLVRVADDCRAICEPMRARGGEFAQEPVPRFGSRDAGFRDPSGNGWKLIETRR